MSTYKNTTLQGNWYEDRLSSVHDLDTTARVLPPALSQAQQPLVYATCKQLTDQQTLAPPPLKQPPQRKLVNAANLSSAVQGHSKGAGGLVLQAATLQGSPQRGSRAVDAEQHYKTTYQQTIASSAAAAATNRAASAGEACSISPASASGTMSITHLRSSPIIPRSPVRGSLARDTYTSSSSSSSSPLKGRAGARGEFTRWPGESGSRPGVSVWLDEYAAGRLGS